MKLLPSIIFTCAMTVSAVVNAQVSGFTGGTLQGDPGTLVGGTNTGVTLQGDPGTLLGGGDGQKHGTMYANGRHYQNIATVFVTCELQGAGTPIPPEGPLQLAVGTSYGTMIADCETAMQSTIDYWKARAGWVDVVAGQCIGSWPNCTRECPPWYTYPNNPPNCG